MEVFQKKDVFLLGLYIENSFAGNLKSEQVNILVWLIVIIVAAVLFKYTSKINAITWLSFSFLVSSIAGRYLYLIWLGELLDFLWHHSYIIALLFLINAVKRFYMFIFNKESDLSRLMQQIEQLGPYNRPVNEAVKELTELVNKETLNKYIAKKLK